MKNRFSPPKGFNTRRHLAADAPYVQLLYKKLHAKIAAEWPEKWQLLGLGHSLEYCRKMRGYSAFIRALNQDIMATCNQQGHEAKINIESSLKRLLNSDKLPDFLQSHTRNMLVVYLSFESWEAFKQAHGNEVNGSAASEVIPEKQSIPKAPIAPVSYTWPVNVIYTFL